MALLRKKGTTTTGTKNQIIKVNPYENPENVLELMAKICSATAMADTDVYWDIISEAYNKEVSGKSLSQFLEEERGNLWNKDFYHDLNRYCRNLSFCLSRPENTKHTQVVVAGGFSSGKSSFLNRLTDSANLLPTGVEPVSVVKTYLYCSRNTKSVAVKGVNQKDVLVNLDTSVLQAIQHAKESNIYLASVLDKLFVEIPSEKLDGLVFIDTPGYNNSDRANQSNGKTDRETALEALGEGQVLFWLVDCERGTTVAADLEIIKQFEGKKVFIFNKADKKGENECAKIVEEAARTLYNEFPAEDIIDILAFSTLDNRIYYSKNKKTLNDIINDVKSSGNGNSEMSIWREWIEDLFEDEIIASNNAIEDIKKRLFEFVKEKNETEKFLRGLEYTDDNVIGKLREVLVKNYSEVLHAAENLTDSSLFAYNSFLDFYNGVLNFENNDHWGSSNILNIAIDTASKAIDKSCNKHNAALNYTYYNENYRKDLTDRIKSLIVGRFKEYYNEKCEKCDNAKTNKENEEKLLGNLQNYKQIFMSAIDKGINRYQQQNKVTNIYTEHTETFNVFDCIKKDNYKSFLRCFENGIDISLCNEDGYNPLTLAVQQGNNMMVKFFINQNVDLQLMDKRGYNAFHTAVENQYRDICSMLLDEDPDLIDTKTEANESVEVLARKQTFSKWIEFQIN